MAQVQQILQQLSQSHPTKTTTEQMIVATEAIKKIESDPTLKQKLISAATSGGLAAFEKALDNPMGAFVVSRHLQKSKRKSILIQRLSIILPCSLFPVPCSLFSGDV
ncbi:MAG: hypothetical protein WBA93_03415 [Microcoleaceae cyanobacterium]